MRPLVVAWLFFAAGLCFLAALATSLRAEPLPKGLSLSVSMERAEAAWGAHAEIAGIEFKDIGDCSDVIGMRSWADFVTRRISINSRCMWNRWNLDQAVAHEYGHLLLNSFAHSLDKNSVMYFQLGFNRKQRVTDEDRERLK